MMAKNLYKLLLLTVLLSANGLRAQTRIAFSDAKDLATLYRHHQAETPPTKIPIDGNVSQILDFYFPGSADLEADVQKNIFLKDFFRSGGTASANDNRLSGTFLNTATESLTSGSGLGVTTIADGIARFLVERTKAELDVYFFEQFRDFLESSDYGKDLKVLFPNTHSIMLLAGKEVYDYQKYLQAFREAFAHDLSSLLVNTNRWINQGPPRTTLVELIHNSRFYPYLQLALQLAVDIQQGKHPGDILEDLAANDYSNTSVWGEFGQILKVSNLLSQSLRSATSDRYWISEDEFSAFREIPFTKIYLGLIYQEAKNSSLTIKTTPLTDILEKFANEINKAQQAMDNFRPLLTETDQILKQVRSDDQDGTAENYFVLANSIVKIMSSVNTDFLVSSGELFPEGLLEDAEFFLTHSYNLVADVRTKSYSAGVIELSLLLKKLEVTPAFLDGIIKYGSFMANVATARTSEEVQQAIEVVALPSGSYRVKRESAFNISFNGYVGFYGGNEYMPASENKNRFSAGLFVPVGFAFTKGKLGSSEKKGGKSFSAFISIIDLGALASFRFNDDNTPVSSDIQLKDIVAPGAFLIYGLGKCPISIGVGAQIGPALRDVDPAGAASINEDYYVRAAGFIVVDIPFFNLYNRKDKK